MYRPRPIPIILLAMLALGGMNACAGALPSHPLHLFGADSATPLQLREDSAKLLLPPDHTYLPGTPLGLLIEAPEHRPILGAVLIADTLQSAHQEAALVATARGLTSAAPSRLIALTDLPQDATGLQVYPPLALGGPELRNQHPYPTWFWVLRHSSDPSAPGPLAFARGLALVDVDGALLIELGAVSNQHWWVEAPPHPYPSRHHPLRLALPTQLEEAGAKLGHRAAATHLSVHITYFDGPPPQDADILVQHQPDGALRATFLPTYFTENAFDPQRLANEHAITWLPLDLQAQGDTDHFLFALLALAMEGSPVASWTFAALAHSGQLQLANTPQALPWYLPEIYARSANPYLAAQALYALRSPQEGAQADYLRHRATLHLIDGEALAQAAQDLHRALQSYTALDFAPGMAECHLRLGDLYATLGDAVQARKHRTEALHHFARTEAQRKTEVIRARFFLSLLVEGAGDVDLRQEAERLFAVTAASPKGQDALQRQHVAWVAALTPHSDTAFSHLQDLIAWHREDPSLAPHIALVEANLEFQAGRIDQAATTFTDAITLAAHHQVPAAALWAAHQATALVAQARDGRLPPQRAQQALRLVAAIATASNALPQAQVQRSLHELQLAANLIAAQHPAATSVSLTCTELVPLATGLIWAIDRAPQHFPTLHAFFIGRAREGIRHNQDLDGSCRDLLAATATRLRTWPSRNDEEERMRLLAILHTAQALSHSHRARQEWMAAATNLEVAAAMVERALESPVDADIEAALLDTRLMAIEGQCHSGDFSQAAEALTRARSAAPERPLAQVRLALTEATCSAAQERFLEAEAILDQCTPHLDHVPTPLRWKFIITRARLRTLAAMHGATQ